jgi:hypothetical protein
LFVCSFVPKDCSGGPEEASSAWKCVLDWRRLGAAVETYRIWTEQHASMAGGACGEVERSRRTEQHASMAGGACREVEHRRRAGAWCNGGGVQGSNGGG